MPTRKTATKKVRTTTKAFNEQVSFFLRRMVLLVVPVIAVGLAVGHYFSARFVQIVALSAIPLGLNYVGFLALSHKKQQKRFWVSVMVGLLAMGVLGWWWQPYNESGFAAAWFFGLLVMNVFISAQFVHLPRKVISIHVSVLSQRLWLKAFSQLFLNLATGWFGSIIILPGLTGELWLINLTANLLYGIIALLFYIALERKLYNVTK